MPSIVLAQSDRPVVVMPSVTMPANGTAERPEGAMDCAIRPSRIVEVASVIDGVLAEVLVVPGQSVKAGDLLARVDTDIAAAELANAEARAAAVGALRVAEARVSAARAQYAAQKKAYDRRVASRVDFERARGELRVAQEEVRREREALTVAEADRSRMALIVAKGEIRAPFDGIIGEELLNPGESIEGRPVAQLIVTSPMRVEVFAGIEAAEAMGAGGTYAIVSRLANPVMATPEFDYVSPLAESSSQTVRVYFNLTDTRIAPGYRCFMTTPAAAEAYISAAGRKNSGATQ